MHTENCLLCGGEIQYLSQQKEMTCSLCGKAFLSNSCCENGHFICDGCHREKGLDVILEISRRTQSKDPIYIIWKMMDAPHIYMHGPEHHIMVGAALLAAYKNAGGSLELETCLSEMVKRGSQVPGGFCGFWGCCGAAVSSGIFLSLVTGTTPLSIDSRALAQKGTAAALERIALHGGPRCCKRNSFSSILAMIDYTKEHLGIEMEGGIKKIVCSFSARNAECLGAGCPFHREEEQR